MHSIDVDETGPGLPTLSGRRRIGAIVGVVAAGGVFVLVALVTPDAGASVSTVRSGIALAAVFAAGPVAALGAPRSALLVSLGGGMTAAGAATTPGGSFLGPLLALSGLLLLWVGASGRPSLTFGVVARMLVYAVLFGGGIRLAIDTESMRWLAAILLALVVGLGPWSSRQRVAG